MTMAASSSPPRSGNEYIADLVHTRDWVDAETPIPRVAARFDQDPLLDSLVVLDAEQRIGLLTRARLLGHFNSQFGYALYQRKPVKLLADPEALIVDALEAPVRVIAAAMQREMARVYDDIIVVDAGRYLGLVSMRYLMAHGKDLLLTSLAEVDGLERQNRRLDEINRAQREFVANMTHELRAPLNTILGISRLLSEAPELSSSSLSDVELIVSSGHDLLGIVNNLLDLYKIESQGLKLTLESVDPAEVVRTCFAPARYLVQGKPIEIVETVRDLPRRVSIDPVLLRRLVANLISNAVKFTDRGVIALEASWQGDVLGLSVADTGIGIRDEDLSKLFRKFTQLDAASSKRYGGTGLGLVIVKNLAELMSGDVQVQSAPGVGTRFDVRIRAPLAGQSSPAFVSLKTEDSHVRSTDR